MSARESAPLRIAAFGILTVVSACVVVSVNAVGNADFAFNRKTAGQMVLDVDRIGEPLQFNLFLAVGGLVTLACAVACFSALWDAFTKAEISR